MTETNQWTLENGWLPLARAVPSPNCNLRPVGGEIELIVIHNISLPPGCFGGDHIEALFTNCLDPTIDPYFETIADLEVSSHFLIRRDGELVQFVSTEQRAWHAGASAWQGRENCNDFSIGIELEGCDDSTFEPIQYAQLAQLIHGLRRQYPAIAPDAIVGHSDIAPGRKTDPGPGFEWRNLWDRLSEIEHSNLDES